MDYKEEQDVEIEVLKSIYYGDIEIIFSAPFHKFVIPIKSKNYLPDTGNGFACNLIFTYTAKYPEEIPIIGINDSKNLSPVAETELYKYITDQAHKNVGMVMIYNLICSGQEWLHDKWDDVIKEREEEKEVERKRIEGTRVTAESFLEWQEKFKLETRNKKKEKLTGNELNRADEKLNKSDLQFLLNDAAHSFIIDESLFQDLGGLELGDLEGKEKVE